VADVPNLPAVSSGGAVVVQPAALVPGDAAASAGVLGGLPHHARGDTAVARLSNELAENVAEKRREDMVAAILEHEPALTQALGALVRDLRSDLIIEGVFDEQHFASFAPILAEYAPAFANAARVKAAREGDDSGFRHLTKILEAHLLTKGLSRERLEWARPVCARYEAHFRRLLLGAPDSTATPSTVDVDELREIERMMGDLSSAYHYRGIDPLRLAKAEQLQARARVLYQHGVRGDSKRTTPPEHIGYRKAELEQLMAELSSEYWKGPNAEALQAEYRDLIR
jgi:hypothetical protein